MNSFLGLSFDRQKTYDKILNILHLTGHVAIFTNGIKGGKYDFKPIDSNRISDNVDRKLYPQ
jgi:hypothetical protein